MHDFTNGPIDYGALCVHTVYVACIVGGTQMNYYLLTYLLTYSQYSVKSKSLIVAGQA